MPLTEIAIRKAKAGAKSARLFDAGGLYLEISPSGGKWWRFKYRFAEKEKRLSLGVYPEVSLKAARAKRDDARRLLADGIDPSEHRQQNKSALTAKATNGFEAVERDLFPWLGARPINSITAVDLLTALRRIESRGALETAHRAMQNCGQVFR